jgi:recombination protein RecT
MMSAQAQAQAATAVATIDPRRSAVIADVSRMEKQFAMALPEHVSPERFCRVLITAINSNPDLLKAERDSVLGAAMKCAQDGLLPDGKEAALVTYGTKAQYLPMIAGILTKVRRSGELKTINAHVVYENDHYAYQLGDAEKIEHTPRIDGPRGKAVAVYAIAHTKDGGVYREWMTIEEVNQVRNVSRAKNNGPWVQWWGEMARKTVLRRLAKRLPMSTDLMQVFQRDDDHYDLSRGSEGAAKLRRLHADFEEPAEEPAQDADFTEAPEAAAGPAAAADDTDDDLPEGLREKKPFDAPEWAADLTRNLDDEERFGTIAKLNAFTDDPANIEKFEALQAASPGLARSLEAAINGRRKALLAKESAQ